MPRLEINEGSDYLPARVKMSSSLSPVAGQAEKVGTVSIIADDVLASICSDL